MDKVLLVTDLHMTLPDKKIIDLDPQVRLRKVLDQAAREHGDALMMIAMGDLAHWGGNREYARLKETLKGYPWPIHLMIGNHDNRANFRKAFPDTPTTEDGHVQRTLDVGDWRLILLDSHDEKFEAPIHSGILCEQRIAWLRAQLVAAKDRRVIICIHHPPMRTFFDGMDEIGLRNQEELLALLAEYPNVEQVVAGHIHRTISGIAGGLPISVFKSPCHQMPLVLGEPGSDHSVDEPGAYGLLLLHAGGVTIHTQDVF